MLILCTWTFLKAVLFPKSFTMCLAIDNILCPSINGSTWNKHCMNTAGGGCLCLDYALSCVFCALPAVELFSVRDFPVQCPLVWLLDSYIWQTPVTATSASLQLMPVLRLCFLTSFLHVERLQDWKLKGYKQKMVRGTQQMFILISLKNWNN